MAEIDPKANYHRTLGGAFAKLPYIDYEARKDVFEEAAKKTGITLGTAYTIRKRQLVPILYELKKDQDFKTYATSWEILHSKLPFGSGSGTADPVVDENMTVVGHVDWYETNSIFVPEKAMMVTKKVTIMVRGQSRSLASIQMDRDPFKAAEENRQNLIPKPQVVEVTRGLGELLRDGVEVHADEYNQFYLKQGYTRPFPPQTAYRIVTDPEGRAQYLAGIHDRESVEPSWVSPLDLLFVVKLVVLAGVALTSAVAIRVLARPVLVRMLRGAATELTSGATRELASGAAREEASVATRDLAQGAARGGGRATLRGVGIVARKPFERLVGRLSPAEMTQYLKEVLAMRPDLRRLMAVRATKGMYRLETIKLALKEFEQTQGWKVVEKTAAEMEAVTTKNNLVTLRAQIKEVWINTERANRWDPDVFYDHVVHDLSAHALAGRGGILTELDLPFVGHEFTGGITDGLTLLERSIGREGNFDWIVKFFGR